METRTPVSLEVIVLAGGTARRLGGVSKADVLVCGTRLLDLVLEQIEHVNGAQLPELHSVLTISGVTVVAPPQVQVPDRYRRALEDPPLGGPVAGIAAGLHAAAIPENMNDIALVGILTCDAPYAPRALPQLVSTLLQTDSAQMAQAVIDDVAQPLLSVHSPKSLIECVAPGGVALRDVSVKRTFGSLQAVTVVFPNTLRDLDTWEELGKWEQQVAK